MIRSERGGYTKRCVRDTGIWNLLVLCICYPPVLVSDFLPSLRVPGVGALDYETDAEDASVTRLRWRLDVTGS